MSVSGELVEELLENRFKCLINIEGKSTCLVAIPINLLCLLSFQTFTIRAPRRFVAGGIGCKKEGFSVWGFYIRHTPGLEAYFVWKRVNIGID